MMRHGIILSIAFVFLFCSTAYSNQSDAPQATGSLSGRILNTDMGPVEDVTIKVKGLSTRTDANGNFRLDNIPAGKRTVLIDGSTAHDTSGHYPTIPISADIAANAVNPMPFQSYLHKQKSRNFVNINPAQDTVLTDPEVPGFEMRIPKGVHITGWDGKANLRVSVRTVPTNRLPIKPLPKNSYVKTVYMFYFDKVGGGIPSSPIPVKYPNNLGLLPGEKAVLWYYDESPNEGEAPNDWAIAGMCTVTSDGRYIVSDPGVGIPKFCCGASGPGTTGNPNPGSSPDCGSQQGDPVDITTGNYMYEQTDMHIPGIIPVDIRRYYRSYESSVASSGDNGLAMFGKGTGFEYDWGFSIYGDNDDLIRIIKPGYYKYDFNLSGGAYTNTKDPAMRGAKITESGGVYTFTTRDGWKYRFGNKRQITGTNPADYFCELSSIEDRNGNALTFERRHNNPDEGGYMTKITTAEGNEILLTQTFVPDPVHFWRTDSITDHTGRQVRYEYEYLPYNPDYPALDDYPFLKKVIYPDASEVTYSYDSLGRLSTIKNRNGVIELTNEYDTDHRVIRQTHPDDAIWTFAYTVTGGFITQTAMTAPNGAETSWSFNSDGYITEKVTPDGTTTYNKVTGTNELLSVTDPLNRTTSYTYYSTSDATNGLVHTTTDPIGNVTTYEYESTYGMPTKITDALNKDTTFTYTITDGMVTKNEIRDPLLHLTTINYDSYGLPSSVTDALDHTTSLTYDPNKHAELTGVTDALGNSLKMSYDAVGRVTKLADAKDKATNYTYDVMDRLRAVVDATGGKTRYFYDLQGNLIRVFDPKGNYIKYDYDDRDRITKMTDQLGRYETYAYYRGAEITSLHGDNLKSITDRKGQTTTFNTYDPMGRLTKVTYNDNSYTQYAYDAAGRVVNINDTISGVIGYTYNDYGCSSCSGHGMDKISQELTPLGTIDYTYDSDGRRASMTVQGEPVVNYSYDDTGRLTGLSRDIGGTVRTYNLGYDNANRRTSLGLPLTSGNVTTTYGYDIANRLLSMLIQGPSAQLENLTYTYDPNGSRTSFTRSVTQTLSPQMSGTSYDVTNEMLAYNSKTLTYDNNGNLTSNGTNTYTWDARDQLTAISGPSLSASFSYDALGRRMSKTINGTTTQYVYDDWDIIQEIQNSQKTNYVSTMDIDEPLTRIKPDGTVRHYVQDALGSVIALTDDTGAVVTTYAYDAFGGTTASGEASDNPFQYTGRENDGTGLYYYRNRYYSPEMQRFISEDPIGLEGNDINFYAYVYGNPVNWYDPEGLAGRGGGRKGSGSKGERNWARNRHGTPTPDKTENPKKGDRKDPQSGKKSPLPGSKKKDANKGWNNSKCVPAHEPTKDPTKVPPLWPLPLPFPEGVPFPRGIPIPMRIPL